MNLCAYLSIFRTNPSAEDAHLHQSPPISTICIHCFKIICYFCLSLTITLLWLAILNTMHAKPKNLWRSKNTCRKIHAKVDSYSFWYSSIKDVGIGRGEENIFTCLGALDHKSFWCPRISVESSLTVPDNATRNLSTASFSKLNTVFLLVLAKSTTPLEGSVERLKHNYHLLLYLEYSYHRTPNPETPSEKNSPFDIEGYT